jgi:mono/diheme cytochrome c family protein
MKRRHAKVLTIAALIMMGAGSFAAAADKKLKADLGKREYENSCALCHGKDGKGTGAINDLLKKSPTDLTTLAKRNKGVFPFDRLYAVIDGREIIRGHGDRDMPAWGDRYSSDSVKAAEYYMDAPYDAEMFARSRILSLIDYLNRIQVK